VIEVKKKLFFKIGRETTEYEKDVEVPICKDCDVFTFIERTWAGNTVQKGRSWKRVNDNVALLKVSSYEDWFDRIGTKTRNMVRKAYKNGIKTVIVQEVDDKFIEGVRSIYNEVPVRQGRKFSYYGSSFEFVKKMLSPDCTYIGAYLGEDLVGFIKLHVGEDTLVVSQILGKKQYDNKAVNNALIARVVEVCGSLHRHFIIYGRMGNHPSLDRFKRSNGFEMQKTHRFFIPVTKKGGLALILSLHRSLKDIIPNKVKLLFFSKISGKV